MITPPATPGRPAPNRETQASPALKIGSGMEMVLVQPEPDQQTTRAVTAVLPDGGALEPPPTKEA